MTITESRGRTIDGYYYLKPGDIVLPTDEWGHDRNGCFKKASVLDSWDPNSPGNKMRASCCYMRRKISNFILNEDGSFQL